MDKPRKTSKISFHQDVTSYRMRSFSVSEKMFCFQHSSFAPILPLLYFGAVIHFHLLSCIQFPCSEEAVKTAHNELQYSATRFCPQHQLEVDGQLQDPAALPQRKSIWQTEGVLVDLRICLDALGNRKSTPARNRITIPRSSSS